MSAKIVDFPDPVGPKKNVCPTVPTFKLKKNGVA